MGLSKSTQDGLYYERMSSIIGPHGILTHINNQWCKRDTYQAHLNYQRKEQWAIKLRFIRPNIIELIAEWQKETRRQMLKTLLKLNSHDPNR